MTDQGELPKPNETFLTPEQIAKSDADLATFDSLSSYAQDNNFVLQVIGGYATEAHLEGRITRPHRDMDAVLWVTDPDSDNKLVQDIESILHRNGQNWSKLPLTKQHFTDFQGESRSENFLIKRRLELYYFDKSRIRSIEKRSIVDSKGIAHEIFVESIESLVADKIAIIQRNLDLSKEELKKRKLRETNGTDRNDLKKLINSQRFSRKKWYQAMIGYLRFNNSELSAEKARARAEIMWANAMRTIDQPQ